jgi:hypothetical protein
MMSSRGVWLVLACVALIGGGQLLFKAAAAQWRLDRRVGRRAQPAVAGVHRGAGDLRLATLLWVYALRTVPLARRFRCMRSRSCSCPCWRTSSPRAAFANTLIGGLVIIAGVAIAVR